MMLDTLKALLAVYGPTGKENGVAAAVQALAKDHADDCRTDAMGNLILEKKGKPGGKTILFSAHMDHVGLVVTDAEETGFLRVANLGGVSAGDFRGRHVVFGNGVEGVAACQPTKGESPEMRHLFVDIGAKDRQDALARVSIGDVCVYAPDCFPLGPHRLAAPAMDDRCACALLTELLLSLDQPRNTVLALFSVQEEVGTRGAGPAAFQADPDWGVALDVTAWGDTPETKLPAIQLGAGPAVKFMDRSMVATPCVRDALLAAAERAGVACQREVLPFGGTDGGAIQHARGGIPTGALSIPCRYVHSACEVIDLRDLDGALAVLKEFVNGEY